MIASLCIVVIFVFIQSRNFEHQHQPKIMQHISAIKNLDAHLNEDILKIRYAELPNYDSLVIAQESIFQRVEALNGVLEELSSPVASHKLNQFKLSINQKFHLIEQFKSQNSVMKNSYNFLTSVVAQDSMLSLANISKLDWQEYLQLLNKVMAFNLRTQEENRDDIKIQLQALKDKTDRYPIEIEESLSFVFSHIETSLIYTVQTNQTLDELLNIPTARTLDDLTFEYNQTYQSGVKEIQVYQLILTLFSAYLIAYIVWVVYQLNIKGMLLKKTNASLEEQVEERTTLLTQERNYISQLIKVSPTLIVSINHQDVLNFINPAVEKLTGFSREELLQQDAWTFLLKESVDDIKEALSAMDTQSVIHRESTVFTKAGAELVIAWTILNFPQREYILFGNDISMYREAEEQLRETSRTKNQFLANMSHELRTPLNAIIGYSEMLQEDALDLNELQMVEDLKKIHSSGRHLLDIINDILDISKIEAGKMELYPEVVDISSFVQNIVKIVEPLVQNNQNQLSVSIDENPGSIYIDSVRLKQCIFNLLSNACKFTHQGQISFDIVRHQETLLFKISDTGIGISEEGQAKLFQPFSQVDGSSTRKFGGTGLGLSITKNILELMGGIIEVKSDVGVGSQFLIQVPLGKPQSNFIPEYHSEAIEASQLNYLSRGKVLIIDDDPIARELLTKILSKDQVEIETASGGHAGLIKAQEWKPDLITLDVCMPVMDGFEVIQKLKELPDLKHIPVVFISMSGSEQISYSLGASAYLSKPVNSSDLLDVIHTYIPDANADILIVEDDLNTRSLLVNLLEKNNYRVRAVSNGKQALIQMKRHQPTLIITDLMMHEMDGFELVSSLQKNSDWAKIPVIVLTAKDLTLPEQDLLNKMTTQVLQKGVISNQSLLDVVNQAILS